MLAALPARYLWAALAGALALTVGVGLWMGQHSLTVPGADGEPGASIIAFELARTYEEARRMMELWRRHGLAGRAEGNILIDMLWVPCYVAALCCGCLLAGRAFARIPRAAPVTLVIVALQLIAGLLDWVENLALLRVIGALEAAAPELPEGTAPGVAFWCALVKFALVSGVGIPFILSGLGYWLLSSRGKQR